MNPEHKTLAKLFSIEYIIMALGLMFSLGAGYSSLASTDQKNADAIKSVESKVGALTMKQDEISDDVQDIKVDVATIKANQENQNKQQEQMRQDVQRILRLLER